MDTNLTSPKTSSLNITGILSAVLSIGVVVWTAGAIAGTASAQTAARPAISETISYSDLDVSTPQGASVLLKRINLAALRVCGAAPSDPIFQPGAAKAHEQCVTEAVENAVAKSGELVVAMYKGTSTYAAR